MSEHNNVQFDVAEVLNAIEIYEHLEQYNQRINTDVSTIVSIISSLKVDCLLERIMKFHSFHHSIPSSFLGFLNQQVE